LYFGFVDAPEVSYWLEELNLDIPFHSRKISRAGYPANDIASVVVRKDDGLPDWEITRKTENRSIVEHDDGPGFFPGRLEISRGCTALLPGQTSDRNGNFQTNRVRPRVVLGIAFGTSCGRAQFG